MFYKVTIVYLTFSMRLIITTLLLTSFVPYFHGFLTNQECSVEEKQGVLEELTQVDLINLSPNYCLLDSCMHVQQVHIWNL